MTKADSSGSPWTTCIDAVSVSFPSPNLCHGLTTTLRKSTANRDPHPSIDRVKDIGTKVSVHFGLDLIQFKLGICDQPDFR